MGKTTLCLIRFRRIFLSKPVVLKNLFVAVLYFCLFMACNFASAEKKKVVAEDSLQYYPPTPGPLDKQEFRRYYREISNFFDSTLLHTGFNGGILVAKNGAVVYEKYVGRIDLRKPDPISDSTSMHVASTSKTFTAVAILRLVQEGKLSLTDTLNRFFPGFPYPGITVQMLLSHRSGLPNYLYFMSNLKWGMVNGRWTHQFATNKDVLQVMFDQKPPPAAKPNTRFSYCNTNFMLLALIIEKITGMPFPEYMQQKLFGPLRMTHTYIFTLKDTATATPSFTGTGRYWDYDFLDGTYGDKNLYTTPQDMLKWDQALYTDQVIRPSLLDSAFTPYSMEKNTVHNYGLGWRLQLLPNGKKVIYHFGKWHGSNAAFARLTDEKATIIIIGNRFNRNIYNTAHLAYDLFGDYMQHHGSNNDDDSPESAAKSENSPGGDNRAAPLHKNKRHRR